MPRALFHLIFSLRFFQKILAIGSIILIGYLLSDFLVLFFITFLFAYLFLEMGSWMVEHIHNWWLHSKQGRATELALRYNNTNIVVTLLYILFLTVIAFMIVHITPQIMHEMRQLILGAPRIASEIQWLVNTVERATGVDIGLDRMSANIFNPANLESIGQQAIGYLRNTGVILTKFFIGLILSYIFVMERKPILLFLQKIRDGNFAFLYLEYASIAQKLNYGFGVIFKAQSLIATVNAVLTSVGLLMISLIHNNLIGVNPLHTAGGHLFPFIFTLSLIVLIFGFIPVFGTFISGAPILIIAYGYGGPLVVLLVTIMIAIVHIIEAYYLNPKIVSGYVHFPVFVTFIILLVSEHFFGLIGLLIGVPLFLIWLSFFEDLDQYITSIKHSFYERISPK